MKSTAEEGICTSKEKRLYKELRKTESGKKRKPAITMTHNYNGKVQGFDAKKGGKNFGTDSTLPERKNIWARTLLTKTS